VAEFFDAIPRYDEKPAFQSVPLNGARRPEGYDRWAETNVYRQRQSGYATVTVTLRWAMPPADQIAPCLPTSPAGTLRTMHGRRWSEHRAALGERVEGAGIVPGA